MVSAMVRGRLDLGTSESRPRGHFSYLLRLLHLLQPAVFAREHSTALADLLHSLLIFIKVRPTCSDNQRKSGFIPMLSY